MIYVFTFLGEFGYELFNWQGLVRKFKTTILPADRIIIGGRTGMDIWYTYADMFIDISNDPFYSESRADAYVAYDPQTIYLNESMHEIKASIREFIEKKIHENFQVNDRLEFIFSSDLNVINGIYFGHWQKFYNIYTGEGYKQNLYAKISYDSDELRQDLENRLQINLSKPYILIQGRKRDIVIRSTKTVPVEKLIDKLSEKIPIVILNFNTGRAYDSHSEIGVDQKNCHILKTFSAHEQAILIKYAAECIFVTENDFGSHIYVPPFMGRDVIAIAPQDVYQIGTTPIPFWNKDIFKFGGKILSFFSENIFESDYNLNVFCELVFKKIAVNKFFYDLEQRDSHSDIKDFLLWPNTPPPPTSHQEAIIRRVGVSDYEDNNPISRSYLITNLITKMINQRQISYPFMLADICGGDGIVCTKIKEHFPFSEIIVQDLAVRKFSSHQQATEVGVKLYGGFLQHLIENNLSYKLDFVLMLNTFRGWHSAQLRSNEQDVPMKTLEWFENNSKFFIVTATEPQINFLKDRGLNVDVLGKGEDESFMICVSR